jgi:hypothetical protein
MIRRIALAAALAIGTVVAGIGAGSASAAPTGPECREAVSRAVIAALAANRVPTTPGQVIQYLQVTVTSGTYILEPCVVTIPA